MALTVTSGSQDAPVTGTGATLQPTEYRVVSMPSIIEPASPTPDVEVVYVRPHIDSATGSATIVLNAQVERERPLRDRIRKLLRG